MVLHPEDGRTAKNLLDRGFNHAAMTVLLIKRSGKGFPSYMAAKIMLR